MSSEVVIRAHNLGKAYNIYRNPADRLKQFVLGRWRRFFDEYWALQEVSVEIYRGETIGIIGRNGSGKSTFLQLVYGTLAPTTGEREIKGRIAALLELGAGFNPEFNGRENVYLAASILGLSKEQIDARLNEILDFAGIGDFIDQPVKLYSSGMYARLAFAVAAHVDADVLIVDEILSVGDAAFTQKCMRFIRKFKEHGTILFVSHDTAAVVNLCDRCVWLDAGRLRKIGPAREICEDYMAALAGEGENPDVFKIGGVRRGMSGKEAPKGDIRSDIRSDILKELNLKNTVEIFDFDPNTAWFGKRGASIISVCITEPSGNRLTTLEGGEEIVLQIKAQAHEHLKQPILGFYFKDRLGQRLFGDNTYLTYRHAVNPASEGQDITASFSFLMPYLPSGDYSISCAIAEGTQDDHVQHHWIDDALFLKVISSHVVQGLFGVVMHDINIKTNQGGEHAHVQEA